LQSKRHLGIHTELLTDSIVELVKKGVVDNSRKNLDNGKTVDSFCMGMEETYQYIDDNPFFEFRPMDYTNDPMVIAQIQNMTAIYNIS
jgi:acyl-CoA hydrolase